MKKCSQVCTEDPVRRYAIIGALIGLGVNLTNFRYIVDSMSDPSGGVLYFFTFYIFSFLLAMPWSLITIFTDGTVLNSFIVAGGAIVNGTAIGAAYGVMIRNPKN